jgi:protein involved in polysaccharide export with SLBB domain
MPLIGNVKKTEIVFVNGMTLMRAVDLAGGVERNSEMVRVRIGRAAVAGSDPIIINLKAIKERRIEDVPLQPWDVIEVSDQEGRFPRLKLSNPIWDPPLIPRKDSSYS